MEDVQKLELRTVISEREVRGLDQVVGEDDFKFFMKNPNPHKETSLLPDRLVYLPAVLEGLKLGSITSFRTSNKRMVESYSDRFKSLGIHHKIKINPDVDTTVFYITKDRDILRNLDVTKEDRVLGEFLGVPDEDNSWYKNDETPSISEVTPFSEYLDISSFQELKYARLVSWVCEPSLRGISRTVDIGKEYYELAQDELLDKYGYSNPIKWCQYQIDRWDHCWYS